MGNKIIVQEGIAYIIKDWISVNKGLLSHRKYLLIPIYNLVMVIGFPVSILPALFDWLDERGQNED